MSCAPSGVCSSHPFGLSCLLNHPWKFERTRVAFFAGFAQVTVIYAIEIVNFILVMASNSHKDIVLNFIILVIIS